MFLFIASALTQHHSTGRAILNLEDLVLSYRAERPDLSALSVREITGTVRKYTSFLGYAPTTSDLTKTGVMGLMASIPNACTANKHRVNLIGLWNHAEEKGLLPSPPRIRKRTEPRREPVVWTVEEVRELLQTTDLLEGDYNGIPIRLTWRIGICILWDTAARIGTLLSASAKELNHATGVWHVPAEHTKGRHSDKMYRLSDGTRSMIADSLSAQRKKLWPYPYGKHQAIKDFGKLCELAGFPNDRYHKFHCIRRTAESYAAANRGIEWAAEAVGHSVAVARKHYVSSAICKPPALIDGLPKIF